MIEKIKIDINNVPCHFLMTALSMVRETKMKEVVEAKTDDNTINVELKVNGVEVPFARVIEDWWRRAEADLDARAYVIAKNAIAGSNLCNLLDTLQAAEFKIRDALRAAGLKGGDDD